MKSEDKPILSAYMCEYSHGFPKQGAPNDLGFSKVDMLRPFLQISDSKAHSNTQSLVGFSVILKCMTLNDL